MAGEVRRHLFGLALGGQLSRKHQHLSGVEQVLHTHALPNTCPAKQNTSRLSSKLDYPLAGHTSADSFCHAESVLSSILAFSLHPIPLQGSQESSWRHAAAALEAIRLLPRSSD